MSGKYRQLAYRVKNHDGGDAFKAFEHILKGGSIDCGGKSLSGLSRFCFLACLASFCKE